MVCMKLYSHPDAYLFGAIRVIVEDTNVKLWLHFSNLNPHALHMCLVIELNPKHKLREVAGTQAFSLHLRRNLERVGKRSVSLRAVVK